MEIAQEKGTLSLFEPERTSKLSKGGFKSGDLVYLAPQNLPKKSAHLYQSTDLLLIPF